MLALALTIAFGGAYAATEVAPVARANTALAVLGSRIATGGCPPGARAARRQIKNPHDPEISDEVETLRCGSIAITKYHARSHHPPLVLLEGLVVAQNHPLLPRQMRMGSTPQDVISFNGEPTSKSFDRLVYQLNDEGPGTSTATLAFSRGRLTSITWAWFIE